MTPISLCCSFFFFARIPRFLFVTEIIIIYNIIMLCYLPLLLLAWGLFFDSDFVVILRACWELSILCKQNVMVLFSRYFLVILRIVEFKVEILINCKVLFRNTSLLFCFNKILMSENH